MPRQIPWHPNGGRLGLCTVLAIVGRLHDVEYLAETQLVELTGVCIPVGQDGTWGNLTTLLDENLSTIVDLETSFFLSLIVKIAMIMLL